MPTEDPHLQLRLFMEVSDSFKMARVTEDALRLNTFHLARLPSYESSSLPSNKWMMSPFIRRDSKNYYENDLITESHIASN
ncbi:hypothetical protein EPI10_002070 [Gossypium australe]|uniref:Uncharacterized protein n=1 Tax=Gossypium australe TaxID=47621 RepID=A0A5B6VDA4_9ROSI|nr:hypothetical protein EPI10_002070 [Gossypium australe]